MLGDRTAPNAKPQKLVSIILPVHDGAETLAEALESLLARYRGFV
jgi:glycosyltransferase involved in cell wall biosynthesis